MFSWNQQVSIILTKYVNHDTNAIAHHCKQIKKTITVHMNTLKQYYKANICGSVIALREWQECNVITQQLETEIHLQVVYGNPDLPHLSI
jgi:hypothetical protein